MRALVLVFIVLLAGCAGQQGDPLEQYLLGVRDGLAEAQMEYPSTERPPAVLLDFNPNATELGKCVLDGSDRYVYLYLGAILKDARSVSEGRLLVGRVAAHEFAHAALRCSDADHAMGLE